MHPKRKKLRVEDIKVESFLETLTEEELGKLQMTGGLPPENSTYGPGCGATSSYNCYAICG